MELALAAPGLRSSGIPTWLTPRPEPLSFLKLNETWKRHSTQSEEFVSPPTTTLGLRPGDGAPSPGHGESERWRGGDKPSPAADEGQAHGPAPQKTAGSSPADPKSAGPLAGPLTLTTHSLHYGGGATTPAPVILRRRIRTVLPNISHGTGSASLRPATLTTIIMIAEG